jgi:hypothetical protein
MIFQGDDEDITHLVLQAVIISICVGELGREDNPGQSRA